MPEVLCDIRCKCYVSWHLTLSDLISRNLYIALKICKQIPPCDVLSEVCVRPGEKFV